MQDRAQTNQGTFKREKLGYTQSGIFANDQRMPD
jgi:hypothetical protein